METFFKIFRVIYIKNLEKKCNSLKKHSAINQKEICNSFTNNTPQIDNFTQETGEANEIIIKTEETQFNNLEENDSSKLLEFDVQNYEKQYYKLISHLLYKWKETNKFTTTLDILKNKLMVEYSTNHQFR